MIKVYQDKTVKNNRYGNCVMACIASILEIPLKECPDINPRDVEFWKKVNAFINPLGYRVRFHGKTSEGMSGYGLATVETKRIYPEDHDKAGENILHMVVTFDGEIIHDPFPTGSEITTIRYFWNLEKIEKSD